MTPPYIWDPPSKENDSPLDLHTSFHTAPSKICNVITANLRSFKVKQDFYKASIYTWFEVK